MKPDQAFTQLAQAIRKHGAPVCQEVDGELWFPDIGGRNGDVMLAKKFCEECPVKNECLQFALVNNEQYGIWGGLTLKERLKLKAKSRTTSRRQ
jgi:WhiB family redox-sensing transcriptional regulator